MVAGLWAIDGEADAHYLSAARLLHTALLTIGREIKVSDRLTLIPFDGTAEHPPSPLFDRCNPGDASTANIAIRTPAHVEKLYQDAFATPLTASLATITKPSNAPQTHLVAFLSNVAAQLAYERSATSIRIVVFSHMAENTGAISAYPNRKGATFTNAAFATYVAQLVRDRFNGIALEIYAMPASNSTPAFNRRIKDAWEHALKTNGITYSWKQL